MGTNHKNSNDLPAIPSGRAPKRARNNDSVVAGTALADRHAKGGDNRPLPPPPPLVRSGGRRLSPIPESPDVNAASAGLASPVKTAPAAAFFNPTFYITQQNRPQFVEDEDTDVEMLLYDRDGDVIMQPAKRRKIK